MPEATTSSSAGLLRLAPGTPVQGNPTGRTGVVGALIVSSLDGSMFAAVPRSLLGARATQLVLAGGEQPVAGAFAPLDRNQLPLPLCETIGLAPIDPGTEVGVECGASPVVDRVAEYDLSLLGETVFICTPDGRRELGVVCEIGGAVEFAGQRGRPDEEFFDAVEVELNPEIKDLVGKDHGGALVVTAGNAAVGLLVGIADGSVFIAPLAPRLAGGRYRLLTEEAARTYNEELQLRTETNALRSERVAPQLDEGLAAKNQRLQEAFERQGQIFGEIQELAA